MTKVPVVIVSGLSGSGKSTAMKALEDIGYFCIDNLPVSLTPKFLLLCDSNDEVERVALVIDIREGKFLADHEAVLESVKADGYPLDVLFLDARDDVLIRRFSETRRKHPLDNGAGIADGIERERRILSGLMERASLVIDSSNINIHQLKKLIQDHYGKTTRTRLGLTLMSFGYKYGVPPEADYVFDVRFIPNPYFIESLRHKTGLEPEVADFLSAQREVAPFLDAVYKLLDFALPLHDNEGRSLVTLAIGCTGGRHRSVFTVCELERHFARGSYDVQVLHRDVTRQ